MQAVDEFKSLPPARRIPALVVLGLSLIVVAVAQRDIQGRPADQMRGPKLLWRLLCLNALGAIGYFSWGRRPPAPPAAA
jgi:hypothetical protein